MPNLNGATIKLFNGSIYVSNSSSNGFLFDTIPSLSRFFSPYVFTVCVANRLKRRKKDGPDKDLQENVLLDSSVKEIY